MPRPTRHTPLTLEILERHVFTITDRELADQLRQALENDDLERIDELITFLEIDTPQTTDVIDCREVKR